VADRDVELTTLRRLPEQLPRIVMFWDLSLSTEASTSMLSPRCSKWRINAAPPVAGATGREIKRHMTLAANLEKGLRYMARRA